MQAQHINMNGHKERGTHLSPEEHTDASAKSQNRSSANAHPHPSVSRLSTAHDAAPLSITDYLRDHPEGFDVTPFGPVDSLILSSLAYLNLDAYAYAHVGGADPVPLIDIVRFTDIANLLSGGWVRESKEFPVFLEALMRSRRYADLSVRFFVNESAAVIEKQFCASTFTVASDSENPIIYLAFRGTDGSFAGWKEDFNLSYRPIIPSHRSATHYVSGVLSALPAHASVMLGGHSKGGNLAEYAAATIDDAGYERITRIFNHDGPSFLNAPSPRLADATFAHKLHKTVPESSIFGMMLEHRDDYRVVKSDAAGPFQHRPFTWMVDGTDFLYCDSLNASAQFFDETLDRWLRSCSTEQRELFIDTVYDLVISSDALTWQEFQDNLPKNLAGLVRDGRNLEPETKEIMLHTLRNLGNSANEALKERIADFIGRMRETTARIPKPTNRS